MITVGFQPPRSPTLKPTLQRLLAEPSKKSYHDIEQRVEGAISRKRSFVDARIAQAKDHNSRAHEIVSTLKEERKLMRESKLAKYHAKLEAAAERRRMNSLNVSPVSSPMSSPFCGSQDVDMTPLSADDPSFALPSVMAAPVRLAVSIPAEEQAKPEPDPEEEEDARPLHLELAAQLEATNGEFLKLTQWIKEPATIGLVTQWLASLGIEQPGVLSKRLLALVYMAYDAEQMFDDSDADRTMAREAARFKTKFERQLKRGTAQAHKEPFEASFTRARRFYAAWSQQDLPKQARQVDEALQRLRDAIMRRRAQHAHEGTEPIPPEDLLAQVRALAGDAAAAEMREMFLRAWEPVAREEDVQWRVVEVAKRAFWDVIKAQVAAANFDGLFCMLGELQTAMNALVAHSPRAVEELSDHFDAAWIKQQADAGCLTVDQVHGLMRFLCEQIASWQAPADDAITREWTVSVERTITATRSMDLGTFISAHLIDFLAGAQERVAKVFERVLELSAQMGSLRETATAMDAHETSGAQ